MLTSLPEPWQPKPRANSFCHLRPIWVSTTSLFILHIICIICSWIVLCHPRNRKVCRGCLEYMVFGAARLVNAICHQVLFVSYTRLWRQKYSIFEVRVSRTLIDIFSLGSNENFRNSISTQGANNGSVRVVKKSTPSNSEFLCKNGSTWDPWRKFSPDSKAFFWSRLKLLQKHKA